MRAPIACSPIFHPCMSRPFEITIIIRKKRKDLEKNIASRVINSWVSCDIISFTGGLLQIDTQSLVGNNFSLYVLSLCLAANMCNFVRFVHSSAA